jgi:hypothetical protein
VPVTPTPLFYDQKEVEKSGQKEGDKCLMQKAKAVSLMRLGTGNEPATNRQRTGGFTITEEAGRESVAA